ncbi:CdaR family protein [Konateibacter massiliensis]|uniref:CdaR family protein n=1 Tax=Konateibacter massiliensis TaxID=2002841 RepID=UPI000C14F9A1|nr:CdaR family protein [Konateibacter massiliensis]
MKRNLTHNWGLKIISILFAIILWLVVVNIIDPVESKSFNNIQVTVENESIIKDQGKVYDIIDNSDVIGITVKGRRSALSKMKASDFQAVADMAEMIVIDTVPIEVTAVKNSDKIKEITPKTRTLKISVEDSATKQFAISTSISGTLEEGYAVGDITVNPSVLKVTGAASVVNKISRVAVTIDVSGISGVDTINNTYTPKFYDSDGDVIEATSLEYKNEDIAVSVDLLRTKEISVSFSVKGTPAADYQYIETVSSPDTITIAGEPEYLSAISSLDIKNDVVDISNATDNVQQSIDITGELPSTVRLVDSSEALILVTAIIEKLETKEIEVAKSNIQILNLSSKYTMNFANNDNLIVSIKGLPDKISEITADDLTVSIDLAGIGETGTKTVPVDVTLADGIEAELADEVAVNIVLTRNNTGTSKTSNLN